MQYKLVQKDGYTQVSVSMVVHQFTMGDVEDVEIYAAQPIYEWQQTEAGKWVMENALEPPEWFSQADVTSMGFRIAIKARLTEKDATWFRLKYQ